MTGISAKFVHPRARKRSLAHMPDMPALRFADGTIRAVPVFPLAPGTKLPLIAKAAGGRGVLDATADASRIVAWWEASPKANIGLGLAGARLVILDVEGPGKNFDPLEVLEHLHGAFGPLPSTRCARTAGGGLHFYFGMPDDRRPSPMIRTLGGEPVLGCERRRGGHYVVAPPSVLATGDCWAWENADPIADAPEWLAGPAARPSRGVTVSRPRFPAEAIGTTRGLAALKSGVEALRRTPAGAGRHAVLVARATWLFELALAGHIDAATVSAEMDATARAVGLPRDDRLDADGRDEVEAALAWAAQQALGTPSVSSSGGAS